MASGCGDATGPAPLRPEIDLVVVAPLAGGGTHLAGLRADGSGFIDLTPDVSAAQWPAWDRAGGRLLYTSGQTIRVLEPDGDRVFVDSQATRPWVTPTSPQWSPDGQFVAFLGDGDGLLYAVSQQGGEPTVISDTGARCSTPPSWSPDGTRLVALCYPARGPRVRTPYLVAADGSSFDLIGSPDLTGEERWGAPVWSPVRDEIAVPTTRTGDSAGPPTYAVTVLSPDGGVVREVPVAGPPGTPAWAPDGQRLAFPVGNRRTSGNNLTVYQLASGDRLVLRMPDSTWASEPAWSPQGDALAFSRLEGWYPTTTTVHVWQFDESGGETQPTPLLAESPAWRPR